jgi:tripartite ATP-independent transporter DctP family solute receptor
MKLKKISVILVAFLISVSSLHAAQKTYRIGYLLSLDSQMGAAGKAFADVVAKRSNGRIHIEQEPDSNLGGEVDMMKGVQQGTVDIAFISGAALPNFVPEVGVFAIPFLFRDVNHAYAVFDGPIGKQYLEKISEKGMVALAWGENGMRHITNSKHPVTGPDDLKGLKIRLPQSDVMVAGFKAFGAEAAPLAFPQLYGALQTGQFDGQENPIATIKSAKFNQVQKYLSVSGHVYDPAALLVSKDVWNELSGADKAIFEEAAKAAAKASRVYAAEAQKSGIEDLRKAGMEVTEQVDRAKFVAALQPVMPDYGKKFGTEVIAAIQNTK